MSERGDDVGAPEREARACIGLLVCPVCGGPLERVARSLRCPAGHGFDIARQGYVDLLPPGHGRSKRTGDTAAMVQARARFLERGHYRPLADAVAAAATAFLEDARAARGDEPATVLDVGCGTGSYIGHLARDRRTEMPTRRLCAFGVDLSTPAVRLASRSCRDAFFFVNDVKHRLCLTDGSVDVLLNVFAPRNPVEFARVLRPGGLLLVAVPAERHLHELRTLLPLLEIEADKADRVADAFSADFERVAEQAVDAAMVLAKGEVAELMRMTPNAWHLGPADWDRAASLGPVEVTASFVVLRFLRRLRA